MCWRSETLDQHWSLQLDLLELSWCQVAINPWLCVKMRWVRQRKHNKSCNSILCACFSDFNRSIIFAETNPVTSNGRVIHISKLYHLWNTVWQKHNFFMTGQGDLSTCTQDRIFFPLGVQLASKDLYKVNEMMKQNSRMIQFWCGPHMHPNLYHNYALNYDTLSIQYQY